MKRGHLIGLTLVLFVASIAIAAGMKDWKSVDTAPPVVVRTTPEAGATGVDPSLTEIRVTFSKPMADNSWSWSQISNESFPETTGRPRYLEDGRTCVMPVKLKPNHTYVIWLNPQKFNNFRDRDGRPAVFYPLVFETGE